MVKSLIQIGLQFYVTSLLLQIFHRLLDDILAGCDGHDGRYEALQLEALHDIEESLAFLAYAILSLSPASAATDPAGDWYTEDKHGVIHVGPCGPAYCGAIVGISEWDKTGAPPKDSTGHSECQLEIIRDMQLADDGRRHGTITDPRSGSVYQAQMWVDDTGVLRLRGYNGLPLLGSTQRWEKFTGTRQKDCHFVPSQS